MFRSCDVLLIVGGHFDDLSVAEHRLVGINHPTVDGFDGEGISGGRLCLLSRFDDGFCFLQFTSPVQFSCASCSQRFAGVNIFFHTFTVIFHSRFQPFHIEKSHRDFVAAAAAAGDPITLSYRQKKTPGLFQGRGLVSILQLSSSPCNSTVSFSSAG